MPEHSPGVLQGTAIVADKQHPSTAGLPDRWTRVDEWYNFDDQPARRRARAGQPPTSAPTTRVAGAMGAGPPDLLVPRLRRRPRPGPPAMGTRRSSRTAETELPQPRARRHQVRPPATQHADCGGTVWTATSRRSPWTTTPATRWSWTSPPTGGSSTSSATAACRSSSRTPAAPSPPATLERLHRQRGRPDRHPRSTRTSPPTSWVYLYYSPTTAVTDVNRRLPLHAHRRHAQPGQREADLDVPAPRRDDLLPRRRLHRLRPATATSTWPPATTPTRSTPTATRRSTSGPAANLEYDAQRTAGNTNDLRGKILRIQPGGRRHVHHPVGQPLRARHGEDPARDLRDGLPQPVPDQRRPDHRHASTSATTARTPAAANPNRGPEGQVEFNVITAPGNYGWPYCTGNNQPRTTTTTSPPAPSAPKFNCARAGQQLAQQHRPDQPAAGVAGTDLVRLRRLDARFPELGGGSARRWAARSTGTTPNLDSATKFPPYYDGKLFVGEWTATGSSRCTSTADGSRRRTSTSFPSGCGTAGRWTWSSARTARSTCSSGAPASTATTPTPALYRIDYIGGGDRARSPRPTGDPDLRPRAADRHSSPAPAPPTRTAARSPTRGRSATAPPRPRPTRRNTYTTNGTYTAHADGHRPARARPARPTCRSPSATPRPTVTHHQPRPTAGCSPSVTRCRTRSRSPTRRTARSTAPRSS